MRIKMRMITKTKTRMRMRTRIVDEGWGMNGDNNVLMLTVFRDEYVLDLTR